MRQVDLDYFVIAALLLCSLYVALTGLIMDLFGVPQFFLHNYAGYAAAGLAGLHLAFNWRRITAYIKHTLWERSSRRMVASQKTKPSLNRRWFLTSTLAAAGGFLVGSVISRQRLATRTNSLTDVGQFYHQWSKPGFVLGSLLSWGQQPARYKNYPDAPKVTLPEPPRDQGLSWEEIIAQRRSRRDYTNESLSLEELSRLLYAASGITEPNREFRAAPSAGALYPIETYVVVHNVTELEPGLYHYTVADHAVEQLQTGDLRGPLVVAGIGQEMLGQAAVCFILTGLFQRTRWKYHERSYRYVLLEAGHIGQNLYLAATSMKLGACAVGAFLDDNLNDLLGLDGQEEAALYLIAVGKLERDDVGTP